MKVDWLTEGQTLFESFVYVARVVACMMAVMVGSALLIGFFVLPVLAWGIHLANGLLDAWWAAVMPPGWGE